MILSSRPPSPPHQLSYCVRVVMLHLSLSATPATFASLAIYLAFKSYLTVDLSEAAKESLAVVVVVREELIEQQM